MYFSDSRIRDILRGSDRLRGSCQAKESSTSVSWPSVAEKRSRPEKASLFTFWKGCEQHALHQRQIDLSVLVQRGGEADP